MQDGGGLFSTVPVEIRVTGPSSNAANNVRYPKYYLQFPTWVNCGQNCDLMIHVYFGSSVQYCRYLSKCLLFYIFLCLHSCDRNFTVFTATKRQTVQRNN